MDHTCHNIPCNSVLGKDEIKIPRFKSGTPEDWIIFVGLSPEGLSTTNCHYQKNGKGTER